MTKASNDTLCLLATLVSPIFNGNTAEGCMRCISSLRSTLNIITQRTHFKPPEVEPEQAPKNMQTANTTQVT